MDSYTFAIAYANKNNLKNVEIFFGEKVSEF